MKGGFGYGFPGGAQLPAFDLLSLSPDVWLRPEELEDIGNGNTIGTWPDQSGNSNDATQSTEAAKPIARENKLDGYYGAQFDGSDDALVLTTPITLSDEFDFYVVYSKDNVAATFPWLGFNASNYMRETSAETSQGVFAGSATDFSTAAALPGDGSFALLRNGRDGADVLLCELNGADISAGNIQASPINTQNTIGGTANGHLVEFILFNRQLGYTEKRDLYVYLNAKYPTLSITVPTQLAPLPPDSVTSANVTIWHNQDGLTFGDGNDVTSWPDESGQTNHMVLRSGAGEALQRDNTLNGYSVIEGIAASGYRTNDASPYVTEEESELWAVFRNLDWTDAGWYIWEWNGAGLTGVYRGLSGELRIAINGVDKHTVTGINNKWYVYRRRITDNAPSNFDYSIELDGTEVATDINVTFADASLAIGHTILAQDMNKIQIAEIIHFDDPLSAGDAQATYDYLQNKYQYLDI